MEQRVLIPLAASHPELGRWLWALEDTRARTKATLAGLDQAALDWTGPGVENFIGSLLYYIALIEPDYLHGDILGMEEYPAWADEPEAFAVPDRDDDGKLSVVRGVSLEAHLARLDRVRSEFLHLVALLSAEQLVTLPRGQYLPGLDAAPPDPARGRAPRPDRHHPHAAGGMNEPTPAARAAPCWRTP